MRFTDAVRSIWLPLALAASAACNASSESADTAAPSDTATTAQDALGEVDSDAVAPDATDDTAAPAETTVEADTAVDTDPADTGPEVRTGFVSIRSNIAPPQTRIVATFLPGGPAYHCPEQVFGDCVFVNCTPRRPADPLPAPTSGVITIAGGAAPVSLSPLADGTYDVVTQSTSLWSGGETLTVSSTGGDVPAFNGAVGAPMRVTVTSPATDVADWKLARGEDLTLTWTGGSGGEVVVLFGTMATEDPNEVECHFQASAGQGVVPTAALEMLPAGDGYFSVASRHVTPLAAGTWSVRVKAESDAVTGTGALVQGSVTLE